MKSSLPTGKSLELNRTAEKWGKRGPEIPALVVLEICLAIAGCAGNGSSVNTVSNQPPGNVQPPPPNLTPMIGGFYPSCIGASASAFTLTVEGQGLVSGSIVRWNGSDRPTTFAGSYKLTAQIPASDIASVGTAAITVFNPADGSLLSSSSTFTIAAGVPPVNVAVDPGGKFAYVVGVACDGFLSTYSINPTTGVLTDAVRDMDLGDGARRFVAVDPSGKFVYVTDGLNDDLAVVMSYAINAATGELTSAGSAYGFCGIKCDPSWLAVDPLGRFVYVADDGGSTVSTLSIDGTTGALTFKSSTATGQASSVAVDPSGKFVYVTNLVSNDVSMYTTNTTTGALTATGTITAGTSPSSVIVDPAGKFAYVTNAASNNVSMYSINPTTGALTSIGVIAAGTSPASVTVDPSSKFAYTANSASNDVSMYMINTANGTLTSIGTIAAGSSPGSIAIHPSGKFAYVTNFISNTVSMYSIDPGTGALTLIGTIGT